MSPIKTANQLEDLADIYQTRKTIRFNLLPVDYEQEHISDEEFPKELQRFIDSYKQVIQNFEALVFCQGEDEKKFLNKNIKIRHEWMKEYTKQDFYENKESLVKYRLGTKQKTNTNVSLREAGFLLDIFQNWIEQNWREHTDEESETGIINMLENYIYVIDKNEPAKRRSDIALCIYRIQQKTNFEFIQKLFKNIQDSRGGEMDSKIEETLKFLEDCERSINVLNNYLLPSQSLGQEIERASLNYYTINKNPKEYSEEMNRQKDRLDQKVSVFSKFDRSKNKNIYKFPLEQNLQTILKDTIKSLEDNDFVIDDFNGQKKLYKDWNYLKLQYAYKILKNYKATQKSKFYELIQTNSLLKTVETETPLFAFKSNDHKNAQQQFDDFCGKCKDIENKSKEYEANKNDTAKKEIQRLKIQRGKEYFDTQNSLCPFTRYKDLCELFKSVAMEYGQIKAKVKGIEKERVDAEKLSSWAVMLEKDCQHYLMIIPRDKKLKNANIKIEESKYNLTPAYQEIKNLPSRSGESDWILYMLESLTLRALEKLCFSTHNKTFAAQIENELKREFPQYIVNGKIKRKDQFSEDGAEIIQFYQAVLSLESTRKTVLIDAFLENHSESELLTGSFSSLLDFQSEMERCCYFRKAKEVSQIIIDALKEKYSAKVYKITSYDLHEDRKKPKKHTEIWKNFWGQDERTGYPTRINPELKINFVERRKDSVKDKSGNEVKRNRQKQAEYILSVTISENNDKPRFDMSFADKNKIISNIEDFNKTFNDKIENNLYNITYYGIDRGNEELLTIGRFQFQDEEIKFENTSANLSGTYKKPLPIDIEAWELPENRLLEKIKYAIKDGEYGTCAAYKNISYCDIYPNKPMLEKKTVFSCMDLSCAKLINGKIVLNGDIATLIRLKIETAKREIREQAYNLINTKTGEQQISTIKITSDDKCLKLNVLLRDGSQKPIGLYWMKYKMEENIVREELEKECCDILKTISESAYSNIDIEMNKINNLRNAICANAVGIITFLLQDRAGLVCFEDLDEKYKKQHFDNFNGNLGSRIEMALLNKFKTLGLVPPNYKMAMSMQSKKEIDQLGIIRYVNTAGTSSNCPHCGQKIDDAAKEENKWKNHQYRCSNNGKSCGFSTYEGDDHKGLDFLKDSDDVAAYNIAKRGFKSIGV